MLDEAGGHRPVAAHDEVGIGGSLQHRAQRVGSGSIRRNSSTCGYLSGQPPSALPSSRSAAPCGSPGPGVQAQTAVRSVPWAAASSYANSTADEVPADSSIHTTTPDRARVAYHTGRRTRTTGAWLCRARCTATEPGSMLWKLPSPRAPTTTSAAVRERSTRTVPGSPGPTVVVVHSSGYRSCSRQA